MKWAKKIWDMQPPKEMLLLSFRKSVIILGVVTKESQMSWLSWYTVVYQCITLIHCWW
jgi:hypothetical protein